MEKAARDLTEPEILFNAGGTAAVMIEGMQRTCMVAAGAERAQLFHTFLPFPKESSLKKFYHGMTCTHKCGFVIRSGPEGETKPDEPAFCCVLGRYIRTGDMFCHSSRCVWRIIKYIR